MCRWGFYLLWQQRRASLCVCVCGVCVWGGWGVGGDRYCSKLLICDLSDGLNLSALSCGKKRTAKQLICSSDPQILLTMPHCQDKVLRVWQKFCVCVYVCLCTGFWRSGEGCNSVSVQHVLFHSHFILILSAEQGLLHIDVVNILSQFVMVVWVYLPSFNISIRLT